MPIDPTDRTSRVSVHLVLVGMMGAGKTTIGRLLAERTGWPYADNDDLVRRTSGREPAEIRATDGEDALHDLETGALVEALGRRPPAIIAAAGAVVLDGAAIRAMDESAWVVWLRARPSTLRSRIGAGVGRRVEATDEAWLARQAEARADAYAAVADLMVDVDDEAPAAIAGRILAGLDALTPDP